MKQVIRKGIKDIIVDEVPDPVVSPHHVVVRPMRSLISSGTETASIHQEGLLKEVAGNPGHIQKILAVMKQMGPLETIAEVRAKLKEYAVLGYAGAGVIDAVHPTVTDLKVGDRVAYGGEGTGHGELILTGRNLVARIPDNVSFDEACFATLGSIALNSIRISEVGIGDTVAVIGQGLVGQLVAQLAKQQGAVVIALDLKQDRVALSVKLGADHGLVSGASVVSQVLALTGGRGVDCAIVAAAAKSAAPAKLALDLTRDRGRLVILGAVDVHLPWNDMYLKEIQLFMSRAYGPGSYDPEYEKRGRDYPVSYVRWTENRNMEEFLRLVGQGRVNVKPMVTHEFELGRAPEAYQTILNPAADSLAVVLKYPASLEGATPPAPVRRVDVKPEPKQGKLGVALVGPGNLAKWAHLPNIKKLPGVSLRSIYSSNGVRAKSYGIRFGAAYCCSDYSEILKDADVDAVVITSRNPQHAPQTLAALEAGKHVFVEKPMALTLEECRQIAVAARQSGKIVTTGFNRRFAPYYGRVKKALKGRSGPAVIGMRVNSPGISGAYWMADPAIGGAILGEACHFVDLMYWLLESEPVRVSAYSLPTGAKDPVGQNNMAASFQFADGSVGNLTYCTVGSKTSGGERVEVFAQGIGAMTEDFKKVKVYSSLASGSSKMFADKGYLEQLQDFVEAIRQGRQPGVTLRDGVRATVGCLAMLESARTLQPVDFDVEAALA